MIFLFENKPNQHKKVKIDKLKWLQKKKQNCKNSKLQKVVILIHIFFSKQLKFHTNIVYKFINFAISSSDYQLGANHRSGRKPKLEHSQSPES